MVSLRLEQETALPREVRKLHADFLLNRRLHGKYGAAAQVQAALRQGVAVPSSPVHLWLLVPPCLKKALCFWC